MAGKRVSQDRAAPARTMAEIAERAGVAESTVSRALAGSTRVSQETKDRIGKIVAASGYSVNTRARSLRTRQSRTIEVVIPISETNRQHFSDPFFSQIISAIGDALAEKGYDLLLSRASPWLESLGADALASNRVDGVIIIGVGRDPEPLKRYATLRRNVSVWGANIPGRSYPVVGSNNLLGGRLVGRHLLAQGRRRLAFLGDPGHVEIGLRHRGFLEAVAAAGENPKNTLTAPTPFDSASAYKSTYDLFENGVKPDAIFAASDLMAISAMQALAGLGIRVPDDVAVVGYDDIALSAYVTPALTTIRQDTAAGGRALVDNLMRLIEGQTPRDIILPTELIVRRSCGEQ